MLTTKHCKRVMLGIVLMLMAALARAEFDLPEADGWSRDLIDLVRACRPAPDADDLIAMQACLAEQVAGLDQGIETRLQDQMQAICSAAAVQMQHAQQLWYLYRAAHCDLPPGMTGAQAELGAAVCRVQVTLARIVDLELQDQYLHPQQCAAACAAALPADQSVAVASPDDC